MIPDFFSQWFNQDSIWYFTISWFRCQLFEQSTNSIYKIQSEESFRRGCGINLFTPYRRLYEQHFGTTVINLTTKLQKLVKILLLHASFALVSDLHSCSNQSAFSLEFILALLTISLEKSLLTLGETFLNPEETSS